MNSTTRLKSLSNKVRSLEQEKATVETKLVNEIVEVMTANKIDVNQVRTVYRKRFSLDRPDNKRYAKRPIKYRDPETNDTWSGVGVLPRWLRGKVEQGYKLEDFSVSESNSQS